MNETATERTRPDFILLGTTLILVIIGTTMIYSSSSIMAMERFKDDLYFVKRQLLYLILGLVFMWFLARFPYWRLRKLAYPAMVLTGILLALVLIPHVGVRVGGATRWLRFGILSFQVTELAKVTVVIFLAHFLTRKASALKTFSRGVLIPLLIVLFLIGLIYLEPDFGTCVILMFILMMMLYLSGSRFRYLIALVAGCLPAGIWLILREPYRVRRFLAFLDPWNDPQRTGYHIIQSLLSFGSGGIMGVGVGDGMQKLFYLPEPHTDFILAVIAEETGFIGVLVILCLLGLIVFRGFLIAFRAPDLFSTLLAAGLTMIIALEAFINTAGVMGLIPLKGLALPFVSYGGTALVMSLIAVGILLNISAQGG
ncbi:MAG: putative lipid II flippase FtsW [Syntrophales bacterium]|jgi:cell division protein FtsW